MGYSEVKFDKDSVFLVTGGAGFIGSNLCEAILKLGYKVICLDNLSTGTQEHVDMFLEHPNYTFIKGDITDLETCMNACKGVDYVLNQAAWGSVPRSIEMPLYYEEVNIRGTLNMMEAARQKGVKKFANAEILSIMPQIKVNKHSCDYARAYLYIFVDNDDIERIKNETQSNKN